MTINKLTVALTLIACAPLVGAMQALDESELNQVTGEGLGAAFDNVVIDSVNYAEKNSEGIYTINPDAFSLKLNLNEAGPEALIISELRFHCSVNEANCGRSESGLPTGIKGGRGVGGYFGTYADPYVANTIGAVSDVNGKEHVALSTSWPAAHLEQKERSFFNYTARGWNGYRYTSTIQSGSGIGGVHDFKASYGQVGRFYRGLPENFFNNQNINVGNLYTLAAQYENYLKDHDAQLDKAANKFDLHFRFDAVTAENQSSDKTFVAFVDAIGARLYGTRNMVWADDKRGLSLGVTLGLVADELRVTGALDGSKASQLSMKGVDAYLPQGSVDQPLTISTVQFQQVKRGKWKTQEKAPASTQMRVEIAPLTAEMTQAPQGHIFVQSIAFGDESNEEVITGREDIYLRDSSGQIVETIKNVKHRAFVPKTVIYNEQVDKYNKDFGANIPNIPNQNVIEIRGLEIQRMVMTTQDLNR